MDMRVYGDMACGAQQGATVLDASEAPKCVDLSAGAALMSKSAALTTVSPGTCGPPSGGEPIGGIELQDLFTFCCV
jgi:hypothetical protein